MTIAVDDIRSAIDRMVDRVSRTTGDRMSAMASVARKCGMQSRTLRRLINGDTKATGLHTAINIREAYKVQLRRLIAEMQGELDAEEAKDEIMDVWSFDQQIAALEAKLMERKEALKNGN
ncbi:hypothetical protein HGP16_25380 [Rhizobium sp. P40RR-XXII]|uniref:hypothetical protein n=1 Tax=Rhizobium sp. P40RR-XXII TaxID=2726739 RepID=UPI0014576119|nr:hypothetical protein [Rhizobium sp. P40RR-XXII]NLS19875.1 hypothetical protein [Rhizobium sp. P40RR-XXII]